VALAAHQDSVSRSATVLRVRHSFAVVGVDTAPVTAVCAASTCGIAAMAHMIGFKSLRYRFPQLTYDPAEGATRLTINEERRVALIIR
jgi:hypothetical protein